MNRVFAQGESVELIGRKWGILSYCVAVAVLMALAAVPTASGQTTWHVDDDALNDPGPGDPTVSDPLEDGSADHPFDAIQEGIDAAADGDTVLVTDGLYTGVGNKDLDYAGKAITVRSENGPETCVIDCEGDPNDPHRGFYFRSGEGPASIVEGLTIMNGYAGDTSGGGGIYCSGSSPSITDCMIRQNRAANAGGIQCSNSSNPEITNCEITKNRGGGVYCYGGSSPTITNCKIATNARDGVFCWPGSPTIADCEITENDGRGISCDGGSATITNCEITENNGGGIHCEGGDPTIRRSTIARNTSSESGGGILCDSSSTAYIANCLIEGNMSQKAGGGVACTDGCAADISNCTITRNTAVSYGGGIRCVGGSDMTVTNCVLWGDSAPGGSEISVGSATLTSSHSNVQGGEAAVLVGEDAVLNWGEGNIDIDPAFAFAADAHLASDSPCIDAGTNEPPGALVPDDLDGNARPLDGDNDGVETADMGAFEFNPHSPSIALSATAMEFFVPEGGPAPEAQVLYVRNCGGGTLSWEVSADCPWLVVDPDTGESTGEVDHVSISIDADGLCHGDYVCEVTCFAPGAANSPRTIVVTLHVNSTLYIPGQYDTIQEAIDAAVNGDELLVADGTYTGEGNKNLDFRGRAITLRSENGPDACIIDCEDDGRGFYFHSGETNDAVVRGFTVTNGNVAAPYGGYYFGGGVYCRGSSPTITDCVVSSCKASDGAGICCDHGAPVIDNCTIIGNSLDGWYIGNGGGLYLSGNPTVTRCTISGNDAGSSSSYFESGGGGVYCYSYSGSPLISECVIANNSAATGGGIGCRYGGPVISDCTIVSNSASGYGSHPYYFAGGGICCTESDATIINCTIAHNTTGPLYSSGGGVCCHRCRPDIVNSVIAGNSAFSCGGGIYSHLRGPKITNCTIVANEAAWGGGFGGDGSKTTLTNSVVWGNDAYEGPELAIDGIWLRVSYSDVRYGPAGVWGYGLEWGEGNIDADPRFVDPDNVDLRLLAGSPCIDAADNEAVLADTLDLDGDGDVDEPIPFDRDGNPRFIDDPATPDTGSGEAPIVDMGAYEFQVVTAHLDIKPGSCPNSLNLNGHGVLSAAIVGTADFDVTQIDVDTLVLTRADGIGGGVTPLQGPPGPGIHVADVATPFDGEPCECHEYEGDGIADLTVKFANELVIPELQLAEFAGGTVVELVVSGQLLDGTRFAGTDCVTIRPTRSKTGASVGASADEQDVSQITSESADSQQDAEQEEEAEQEVLAMPSTACGMLSPLFLPLAFVGMSLSRHRRRRRAGRRSRTDRSLRGRV